MAIRDIHIPGIYPNIHGFVKNGPNTNLIAYAPILCTLIVFTVVTFAAYLYRALRLRDKALLRRSPFLLTVQVVSGTLYSANGILHGMVTNYPCFIDVWLIYLCYHTWMLSLLLNMARHYVLAHSHRIFGRETRKNPVTPENLVAYLSHLQSMSSHEFWQNSNDQKSPQQRSDTDGLGRTKRSSIPAMISKLRRFHDQQQQPDTSKTEIAPFAEPPDAAPIGGDIQSHQQNLLNSEPVVRPSRKAIWSRRTQSNRFVAWVVCGFVATLVVLLIILNIFSPQMRLNRIFYNCVNGWEFYPLIVTTGVFHVIVCPAYIILIWPYHDAYGIRNSIFICFTLGVLMWAGALTWRIIGADVSTYVSPSLFYLAEIFTVYVNFIVVPTITSIRFGQKQRRGSSDTERAKEHGAPAILGNRGSFQGDLSKQSLLAAMQDTTEHEKIRKFASSCFCTELIIFLDVYLALKASIFLDIQSNGVPTATSLQRIHIQNSAAAHSLPPSIASAESSHASLRIAQTNVSPRLGSAHRSSEFQDTTGRMQYLKGCRLFKMLHPSKESLPQRKSGIKHPDSDHSRTVQATTQTRDSAILTSLTVGVSGTMVYYFPDMTIDSSTPVSENLRDSLNSTIKTFTLPESPFAINASSCVVDTAHAYLAGGQFTFGSLDKIKDEVVDLLYLNVYLRYRE
ncbi:hypothetical protein GQ54DRAFT_307469 [Martensiomyces pterosporus]|nr:hypothetical protein GQ54DRAFT_307469 [Martensiomyces pterosporus]